MVRMDINLCVKNIVCVCVFARMHIHVCLVAQCMLGSQEMPGIPLHHFLPDSLELLSEPVFS